MVKSQGSECAGGMVGYLAGSNAALLIWHSYNIMPQKNYIKTINNLEKTGSMLGTGWGTSGIAFGLESCFSVHCLYEDLNDNARKIKNSGNYYIANSYTASTNIKAESTVYEGIGVLPQDQMYGPHALDYMSKINSFGGNFCATDSYPKLSSELRAPWKQVGITETQVESMINSKIKISETRPEGNVPIGTIWI